MPVFRPSFQRRQQVRRLRLVWPRVCVAAIAVGGLGGGRLSGQPARPRCSRTARGRGGASVLRRLSPRRLRVCLGVLVELSAPPTGSASAPRRGKMRGRDHRWCAGGNRCRHPSNGAGRIAAGRDGGSGGGHSSLDSAGRSQRCRRSVRGSGPTGARRAGGGGVAGAALAPVGPARGCRQRRDRPDWHRVCDRVQDAHVRCAPPGPRPADGRVALPASPALVSARSAPGAVRGACPRVGGGRGRGSCGLA